MVLVILLGVSIVLMAALMIGFFAYRRRRRNVSPLAVAGFVVAAMLVAALPPGGYLAYFEWDLRTNYSEIDAEVIRIVPICVIEGGRPSRRTRTAPMDCLLARSYMQRPEYSGNWVVQLRRITFAFTSPADGRRHEATLDVEPRWSLPVGRSVRILAHDREPERINLPR